MKKFLSIILSLALCMGCQKKEKKKQLKICVNMEPHSLDNRKNGNLVPSSIEFMLFNGLTTFQKNGKIGLSLAKKLDISKDQKTYTFYLRDAKWSDGKEITAYDFEKSWKKILDPAFPSICPQLLYPILNAEKATKGLVSLDKVGVKALNKKTLKVTLKNPCPYFLSLTSFCIYFPIPTHIDEKFPHWANEASDLFVCSGPFTLKKWNHHNELILEKNEKYWNAKNIKLDSIQYCIVKDENTALQMFENGEVDWIDSLLSPFPLDSIPTILQKKEHNIKPIGGTTFCTFNMEKFPFNNKNIRKAFGLAINRKAIVDNITQANELVATRCIPPMLMNNKNVELYKDNDIENAKKFFEKGLEELNVKKEDLDLTFTYGAGILHKKQAEALQETWVKTFNIPIKLEQVEQKAIWNRLHKNQFQFSLIYWIVHFADPINIFNRFKDKTNCKNYSNWENEEYIKKLNYLYTLTDLEKRNRIFEELEKIFIDDMPIAPIYHHNLLVLQKDYVKDLFIDELGGPHFDEVKITKKK